MSVDEVMTMPITRNVVASLVGQTFSYDCTMLGPIISAMRVLFSRVCKVCKDWSTDLDTVDPSLAAEARQLLCVVVDLKNKVKPMERQIIPQGYRLTKVVISSDSSMYCYAFLVYFVSEDKHGGISLYLQNSRKKLNCSS